MKLLSEDVLKIDDELYLFANNMNLLYKINISDGEYAFLGKIPERNIFAQRLVSKIIYWERKLYLIPLVSGNIWIYSLGDNSWERIEVENYENNWADSFFRNAVVYKEKLYIFGGYYPAVVILDLRTNTMTYLWEPFLNKNNKGVGDLFFRGEPIQTEENLYFASGMDNSIFKFNMENYTYDWIEAGNKNNRYSGIEWDGFEYWLAPRNNGMKAVRWNGVEITGEYETNSASQRDKSVYIGIIHRNGQIIVPAACGTTGTFTIKGEKIQITNDYYSFYKKNVDEIYFQDVNGKIHYINVDGKVKIFNGLIEEREFVKKINKINDCWESEKPTGIFSEGAPFSLESWLAII